MQFRKLWLNINGANRMVVFDPEVDTLADVLRRIGLTGTKVGCDIGVCGVCSVIVDGKVIRSCTKKMKTIPEFAKITTIEGVGTPNHLHPLQQAFITFGSVQCGFCIPGFIVSAYQLLQENPDPTRADVRAWFQKNRNYCRCTGYKQIVDAVMAAAKVMRGECTMDDIIYQHPKGESYYNSKLPRPSALGKVCGTLDYGEDASLKMPDGTLHVAVVQPRVTHHANITKIDTSVAEKMPGVVKVITAEDIFAIGGNNLINQRVGHPRGRIDKPTRPILANEKIVRWGDIIALVVADTRRHAREAAKFVKMEYEELPAYLTLPEAVAPDAVQIHPGYPNTYITQQVIKGENIDDVLDECDVTVSGSFHTSRQPHLSMEGDIVIAYKDEKGRLTLQSKSQGIYPNLMVVGAGIGLKQDQLRILQHGAVGASFGWSIDPAPLSLAGAACLIVDAPVCMVMTWEEHQHYDGKRSSSFVNATLGADKDGHLKALKYDIGVDHGAYVEGGDSIMPKYMKYGNPYVIDNVTGITRMVSTNHNHCTAWRGYGVPQNATSVDQLMDMMAEKLGKDLFEYRYQVIMDGDDHSVNDEMYHGLQYKRIMDMARPFYRQWQKEAAEKSTDEVHHAVGFAPLFFLPLGSPKDKAEAKIAWREDGKFYVYETYHDMGQGGDIGTLSAALGVLKPLGVTPADIVLDINDSDDCPNSGISAGSRSHYMNSGAIHTAGTMLLDAMRKEDGTYRTREEMVAEGIPTEYQGLFTIASAGYCSLDYGTGLGDGYEPKPMMGFVIAEVEVNMKTGKPKVDRIKSWADCGIIANYLSAEGQAYGGFGQNIGYAFTENYDDVKKHGNIIGAGLLPIDEVPDDMEVIWIEDDPNPVNPFGSNGLSECFFGGEHTAFLQAVYLATGVRIWDIPADPKKIKAGIDAIARGEEPYVQPEYYLGTSFDDEMDDILAHPVPKDWLQRMIAAMAASQPGQAQRLAGNSTPAPEKKEEEKELTQEEKDARAKAEHDAALAAGIVEL